MQTVTLSQLRSGAAEPLVPAQLQQVGQLFWALGFIYLGFITWQQITDPRW